MAEQIFVSERDLERALRDLGQQVDYPATPELAARVRVRLAQRPPPARRRAWLSFEPGWQRAAALALVALLVLFGAALAISPEARNAVAERLGLRGVTIEHIPEPPTPAPTSTPAPTPSPGAPTATAIPPGASLGLGTRTSLLEARTQAAFPLLTLTELGVPDAIYVLDANRVSMVYLPRAGLPPAPQAASVGLLLSEFRATIDATLWGKGVPPGARLEQLQVNGQPGYFISGAPHTFFYRDATGNVRDERQRLAGNTLLWQQGELIVRIESALDREASLRMAASLR